MAKKLSREDKIILKAKELVGRFEDVTFQDSYCGEGGTDYYENYICTDGAIKCAIICIKEKIETVKKSDSRNAYSLESIYEDMVKLLETQLK